MLNNLRHFELDFVLKKIKLPHDTKILDFGAADGYILKLLNEYRFNCVGVDLYNSNYPNGSNNILIYSGHYFLGRLFPIALRSALSRFLGYSCHCFIISKK